MMAATVDLALREKAWRNQNSPKGWRIREDDPMLAKMCANKHPKSNKKITREAQGATECSKRKAEEGPTQMKWPSRDTLLQNPKLAQADKERMMKKAISDDLLTAINVLHSVDSRMYHREKMPWSPTNVNWLGLRRRKTYNQLKKEQEEYIGKMIKQKRRIKEKVKKEEEKEKKKKKKQDEQLKKEKEKILKKKMKEEKKNAKKLLWVDHTKYMCYDEHDHIEVQTKEYIVGHWQREEIEESETETNFIETSRNSEKIVLDFAERKYDKPMTTLFWVRPFSARASVPNAKRKMSETTKKKKIEGLSWIAESSSSEDSGKESDESLKRTELLKQNEMERRHNEIRKSCEGQVQNFLSKMDHPDWLPRFMIKA